MKEFGDVKPEENALLTTPLGKQVTTFAKSLADEINRVLADKGIAAVLEALQPTQSSSVEATTVSGDSPQ